MDKTRIGIGSLVIAIATMLAGWATPDVSNGSGARGVPVEAYSHDVYFY